MARAYPGGPRLTRPKGGHIRARMAVVAVELVRPEPDWAAALARALERPPGVPERRERPAEQPAEPADGSSPPRRRIADELLWLRDIIEDPEAHGFKCEAAAAHLWWPVGETDSADTLERLERLRERGILDAAGFLLHDESLEGIDLDEA
jgi:hypothetical protein